MEITISVEGATPEEIARGVTAAKAVFHLAQVTPEAAADGLGAVETWDRNGCTGPLTGEDLNLNAIWCLAEEAGLDACCDGWRKIPEGARLELFDPDRASQKIYRRGARCLI